MTIATLIAEMTKTGANRRLGRAVRPSPPTRHGALRDAIDHFLTPIDPMQATLEFVPPRR